MRIVLNCVSGASIDPAKPAPLPTSSKDEMESACRILAAALTNTGTYHQLMGRFDEAIGRYQSALQMRMRVIRPDADQDIANEVAVAQRELEILRAEHLESDNPRSSVALDLYEHRSWEERCMVHIHLKPIRVLSHREGEHSSIRQPSTDEDYRDSAITFYNMGVIHLEKESIEKAGQLFVMASTVIPLHSHPDIAASILNALALVLYLQDKARESLSNLTEAVELERRARADCLEGTGRGRNGVDMDECLATTLSLLGRIHYQSGGFDLALRFCNQLLRLRQSTFGSDDLRVAATAYNVGLVLFETGKKEEGVEKCGQFIKRVSNWTELDQSLQRPNVASALHVTGIMQVENARVTKGLKLLTLALEARLTLIGADHIEVAKTHLELGKLKRDLGQYVEAKTHYAEALRISRAKLGEGHDDVASIWVSIGQVHYCRGELDEVLVVFNQVLRHIQSVNGERHDLVTQLLNAIGNILLEKGEIKRAMDTFVEETRISASIGTNGIVDPSRARNFFPMVLPNLFHSIGRRFFPAAAAA